MAFITQPDPIVMIGPAASRPSAASMNSGYQYFATDTGNISILQVDPATFVHTWVTVSAPPSGSAGGDLRGSYPNPTVGSVTLPATTAYPITMGGSFVWGIDADTSIRYITTVPLGVGGAGVAQATGVLYYWRNVLNNAWLIGAGYVADVLTLGDATNAGTAIDAGPTNGFVQRVSNRLRIQSTTSLVRVRVDASPAASGNLNMYQQADQGKAGAVADTLTMNLEQRNSANVIKNFSYYQSAIVDPTSTAEYGALVVGVISGGAQQEIARFYDDADFLGGTLTKTLRFAPTDISVSTYSAIRFTSAGSLVARIIAEGGGATVTIAPNDFDTYLFSDTDAEFGLPLLIGSSPISTKAILTLNSTTKVFLPPRQTTVQRDAMGVVDTGSIIFNITTNAINVYYGGAWHVVTAV